VALTTLSQIRAFLNSQTSADDVWLEALRLAAEGWVKTYCGQQIEAGTYTEYHSGNGSRVIVLRERPVTSVTSVHEDYAGAFGQGADPYPATTLLTAGEDYALERDGALSGSPVSFCGVLWRHRTTWRRFDQTYNQHGTYLNDAAPYRGNIKVVYAAGYSAVPQDVQLAVCMMAAYFRSTVKLGGHPLQAEKIGDYSYEIYRPRYGLTATMPETGTVRDLLSRYKNIEIL